MQDHVGANSSTEQNLCEIHSIAFTSSTRNMQLHVLYLMRQFIAFPTDVPLLDDPDPVLIKPSAMAPCHCTRLASFK